MLIRILKKSQAAMEFLMTYGWAILVVLVAIGALAYFGVLSPDRFLPSRCTLPSGIACVDHEARSAGAGLSELDVQLRNGLGYDITSIIITASGCGATPTEPLLRNGGRKTFTLPDCSFLVGERYSGDINVTYTNSDTGLTHKVQGMIITKVVSTS